MSGNTLDHPRFPRHTRFEPVTLIGQGAMGLVFRARDLETDSIVALKTLAASGAEDLYRLKAEFRVLSDLVHPGLVELYELFTDKDESFFTMEYVPGKNFVHALRDGVRDAAHVLANAAGQLAQAVTALHAAGRLHRDIKPSNVLVTSGQRVVVLDFGLATMFAQDVPLHYAHGITGTLAYMAPELVLGASPSPAGDWYSVGVLLYEALTGQLPVDPMRSWLAPAAACSALPEPWRDTIALLLDESPECRARGADRLLGERTGGWPAYPGHRDSTAFVGRKPELEMLARARACVDDGEARIVRVVGPSGIGKSEMVRRFLSRDEKEHRIVDGREAILSGRCHPQESVPYKAIDPIIDQLSRLFLADASFATACVPADAGALRLLFPVLDRVEAFASSPTVVAAEPIELRRRGFAALRELFHRLAQRARVTVWIDDLQWSDSDSLVLLRELMRPPAPPVLAILSFRNEDPDPSLLPILAAGASGTSELQIDLGPLSPDDGASLVAAFGESGAWAAEVVAEANGNPFFLSELARSLAEGRGAARVADLVGERLADLGEHARVLLEIVGVSGGPIARSVALEASGLGERGRPVASQLEKKSLLRTVAVGEGVGLEMYHDRIRETLLGMLPLDATRAHHGSLADVLESRPAADAEALYRHNLGAGRSGPAARWAEVAAERAASSLAFQRAAELFGEALALADGTAPASTLLAKRAEALANSGRALDAARTYEQASRALPDESGIHRREILRLRERAATHYLQTGHLEEGLAVTRAVLHDVGIRYPRSQGRAILSSLVQRAKLGLRGFRYELRPGALSDMERLRLDACWNAAISLTMVDPAGSDTLGMRHLLEALDSGDPLETMRALGGEAGRSAQLAGKYMRRRCARLTDMMEELVHEYGQPFDHAHLHSARGMIAFQSSLWRKAHDHFAASSAILRRDCFGVSWEKATIDTFRLSALAHSGQFRRLAGLLPDAIGDASDRGDIYAALLFHTGVMNQDWLVRDQADEALAVAEETMARWPASEVFQVQHYVHLIATVNADLYRHDPWSAFSRVEAAWPRLRAAMFLALESARVELRNLRARAALAAATAPARAAGAKPPDPAWPRERLLSLAATEARKLARIEDVVSARPLARLLEAGVKAARGDEGGALEGYGEAESMLRNVDMSLHAAAAAWRAATLSGRAGMDRMTSATDWCAGEGIVKPERMLAAFAF